MNASMRGLGLELPVHLSILLATLVGVATCTPATFAPHETAEASEHEAERHVERASVPNASDVTRTTILIALDGVRWQEVFQGVDDAMATQYGLSKTDRVDAEHLVPRLHRLMTIDGAAVGAPGRGAPIVASGPNFVSLPGYMEMLTGRRSTGCTSNDCERVRFPTIAEDVVNAGFGPAVAVTSWEAIDRAAASLPDRVLVSAGRHGGANRAALVRDPRIAPLLSAAEPVAPTPGWGDFRPDSYTAKVALAVLESKKPAFLFVGLGETDEYGHRNDYKGYLRALQAADAAVGALADAAFRMTAMGRPTTLFITTDHGRADSFVSHGREHPESSRVWLVATGAGIDVRGLVPSVGLRHLADVAPTIRQVAGLPPLDVADAGDVLTELLTRPSFAVR
jgi:hypothetical protein